MLALLNAPTHHVMPSATFHDRPVFPRGFRCASRNVGLKPKAKDLALFVSDVDAAAAAVFTRNQFPGAPVIVGREIIRGGRLRGDRREQQGQQRRDGRSWASRTRVAWRLPPRPSSGRTPEHVLVSSTGVIGVPLPIEMIEQRHSRDRRATCRTIRSSVPKAS